MTKNKDLKGKVENLKDLKFKDEDSLFLSIDANSNDKMIFLSSNGKAYSLDAADLPSGRGHGTPLKILLDIEEEHSIVNIFPFNRDAFLITFFKALRVVNQISFGLCSTHPFFGKYWLNSNWDVNFILPSKSKRIALDDVVPWSIATRNFFTILVYT